MTEQRNDNNLNQTTTNLRGGESVMYVNPFVAGVIVTILAEVVIICIGAYIANKKNQKK